MQKKIAFDFILDLLFNMPITVKPMFGCHAVYRDEKIVLITRKKKEHQEDNGVWIATSSEHHESLRKIFPNMRSIKLLGNKETEWQNLPEDADDFEESVQIACEMVLKNDHRIGRVPKRRSKSRQLSEQKTKRKQTTKIKD